MELNVKVGDVLAVFDYRSKRPIRTTQVTKVHAAYCVTDSGRRWSLRDGGTYPRKDRMSSWSGCNARVATPNDLAMATADFKRATLSRFVGSATDAEIVALAAHLPKSAEAPNE